MTRRTTADATSGSGSGILVRIVAILFLLSGCAAAGARAEQAAGTPDPVPAAVSAEAPAPAAVSTEAPGPPPAPAARTPPASGAGLAHRATPAPSFKNDYALLLGIQYWNRLDDFDPAIAAGATGRAGRFDPVGFNIEGSYHRRISRWPGWDLLFGGDLGLFYHGNKEGFDVTILPSGSRISGELSSRGLYLTPSLKLFSGEPAPWRFSVGAGAGYFLVDVSTNLEDGMTVDTYFREGALGGYLSAGADRILSRSSMSILLRLEGKVLFADFGSLGTFAPGAGSLTGPVFLFQAGIAVAD